MLSASHIVPLPTDTTKNNLFVLLSDKLGNFFGGGGGGGGRKY